MIQLLAIDMDGTCLNDKKLISDETMAALRQAAEAGILIVPTTGRTTTCLPYQLKDETFYRYIISSNGAVVTDVKSRENLHSALIPSGTAENFLRECAGLHIGVIAHINHEFVLQGHLLKMLGKLVFGRDASYSTCTKNVAADLANSKTDVEELQLFFFSKSSEQALRQVLDGYDAFLKAYSSNYVELYAREASKGSALAALAEKLGIPKENVACIGDAENDLSMFEASGMKFAMGNAIPELKAKADVMLPSNNDSGVAVAIREHLL